MDHANGQAGVLGQVPAAARASGRLAGGLGDAAMRIARPAVINVYVEHDGGLPAAGAAEAADSAAWAYARGLIGPGTFRQILDRLRAGPAPEALAREPEIARRLQAALALRKPGPLDPKLPWEVGFNRGSRASTTDRIEALKGLLPDPPVTALQAPDAWTYLRSLRIAGLPDLVCPEVRRLAAASVARTEADRRRLRAFMDACGAEP